MTNDDDLKTKSLGGRPPLHPVEATVPLTTRVTLSEYDRIVRMAHQRETSVSAMARRLIVLRLP